MNILVIHASAGAGHFKAAQAIHRTLQRSTGHQAVLVDALDYTSPAFKKIYKGTYFFLISKIPWLWGFFFWLLDVGWLQPAVRMLRRVHNSLLAGGLTRFLMEQQFDYILMTHFMPTEIAAALKRSGRIRSRLITVITDFDVHRIWLAEGIDHYTVATDWTKEKLRRLGIPAEEILACGIPTDEQFTLDRDITSLKDRLGLAHDLFTVLIATGSFGIGPIEEIIESLQGFQIMVVCGHNKSLYAKLSAKNSPLVKVFGLVDNMAELMAAADVMVTKPGGLSISEALVSQLPLIFFNAIPGQETGNVRVLAHYGIGVSGGGIGRIFQELTRMSSSKDYFLTALKKTKVLSNPSAAKEILTLIQ